MLTPQFLEMQRQNPDIDDDFIDDWYSKNGNDPQYNNFRKGFTSQFGHSSTGALLDYYAYGDPNPTERFEFEVEEEEEVGGFGEDLKERGKSALEGFGMALKGEQSFKEAKFQGLGQLARAESDVIGKGIMKALPVAEKGLDVAAEALPGGTSFAPLKTALKAPKIMSKLGMKLLQSEKGQQALLAISNGWEDWQEWREKSPNNTRIARDLEAVVNIAEFAPLERATPAVKSFISSAKAKAIETSLQKMDDAIRLGVEKGIKPTVRGKKTFSTKDQFHTDTNSAVKSIVQRKGALELTDAAGEIAPDIVPQNLNQFSQAIEQTKKSVFDEFNDLKIQAGEQGAELDTARLANELIDTATDPKMAPIADKNPELIDYLFQQAERLEARGAYTPDQAQEAVKLYNESLQAFYRNPTYESYTRAGIDSLVVNNLRKGTDEMITGATGTQYKALKKEYGALKAIEQDVTHRAIVNARRLPKGLIDFSDIFSAGDLARGMVSANAGLVAKGGMQYSIKSLYRWLNNPNRVIKAMFKRVDKTATKLPDEFQGTLPQVSPPKALPRDGASAGTKVFHATDKEFTKFDIDKSQGGGVWFTNRKDLAEGGKVGASGKGRVIETSIDESKLKLAGWDDYDKFSTQELLDKGFDGVKLPDGDEITYGIFNPDKLPSIKTAPKKAIPKDLEPLAKEARKYGSAEEFINKLRRSKTSETSDDIVKALESIVPDDKGIKQFTKTLTEIWHNATGTKKPTKGKPTPIPGSNLNVEDLPF